MGTFHNLIGIVLFMCGLTATSLAASEAAFEFQWKFTRGDVAGAETPSFNDASWASVDLPHDWSIAGPFDFNNPIGTAGGFLPTGIGWYRKVFDVPSGWSGKRVVIEFDGSYMLTEVYLNGRKLGEHVSGFSPFDFDLTPYLNFSGANTLAVRVDNSQQPTSRWYTGSGIYRHVRLVAHDPIHIARFGTSITTPRVSEQSATVNVALDVAIDGDTTSTSFDCATKIFLAGSHGEPAGEEVTDSRTSHCQFNRTQKSVRVESQVAIVTPKLWSPDSPTLYVAQTTLTSGGRVLETRRTTFGIRSIEIAAATGFLLNGKPIVLYGSCVHEDNGALGVAAFDRAIIRRVEALKDAGFNAVRCAHNPPAPAFLDACDRLGLLVIDEAFDTWSLPKNPGDFGRYFESLWQSELDTMILRDRNHPSVVIWSIGNEIIFWSAPIVQSMSDGTKLISRVHELDPTRFVTTAVAGWNLPDEPWEQITPLLNKLDLVGYNYAMHRYQSDHSNFPRRVIIGTESFPRDLFKAFDSSNRLSYVIGDFVWTGLDYLGESGIGRTFPPGTPIYFHLDPHQYPYHGAYCGDIDITGFRKPISHARNITWGRGEKLYTSVIDTTLDGKRMGVSEWGVEPSRASWTWPGYEGKLLPVLVYSRYDAVRLYLNDKLIGEKPTSRSEHFRADFDVPYAAGALRTVGVLAGKEVESSILETAGPVASLRLTADRSEIAADGQDLSFVTVESVDKNGKFQPNGDQRITFEITGPAICASVASADFNALESYQGNQRKLFQGRAQIVVRSLRKAGTATVRVAADQLNPAKLELSIR